MTQEDKKLLLQDLCCRLPYGVNVDIKYSKLNGSSLRLRVCSEGMLPLNTDLLGLFQEEEIYLKPYLRPMSSMTEEEIKEISYTILKQPDLDIVKNWKSIDIDTSDLSILLDWLLERHFDFRGLIPMGLAIEAPGDMYKN